MSRIRPIPKRDLPHSITLTPQTGAKNIWGKVQAPGTPILVSRVYVEPIKLLKYGPQGDENAPSALIFYDAVNSSPQGVTFTKGDKVTFNGEDFTVTRIEPQYGNSDTVHHLEIEVT